MIPADHIIIDGDTAWLVVDCPPNSAPASWEQDDKPCDTCDGMKKNITDNDTGTAFRTLKDCSACHGTGRHVFDLEVYSTPDSDRIVVRTHKVHVVPGMVLEIVRQTPDNPPQDVRKFIAEWSDPPRYQLQNRDDMSGTPIILPPAAKPGMWAIQLKVV